MRSIHEPPTKAEQNGCRQRFEGYLSCQQRLALAVARFETFAQPTKHIRTMKNLLILVTIFAASALYAEQPNDELGKLRESYTKALERAAAPLTVTYIAELKKLIEKHTKAGNLDAALAARTELEAVSRAGTSSALSVNTPGVPASSSPPNASTNPTPSKGKLSASEKKRIESYFVGKTWGTLGPDGIEITELQHFSRNGTGARKVKDVITTNLKWIMKDDGTVNVTEAGFPKEITFVSTDQATMIVHAAPPKGDLKQELKLSSETIPGVK